MSKYMISDAHGAYLRKDISGNYVPVRNQTLGDVWESREKAKNILNNCVNKNLRSRYHVIDINEKSSHNSSKVKEENKTQKTNYVNLTIDIDENHITEWSDRIEQISDIIQGTDERKEKLSIALSDVDKEILDIHHYIEWGKFNAYQGYLAFKMLKERLERRRRIKDELWILTQLGECKVSTSTLEDMKANIANLKKRIYQPRILLELFESSNEKEKEVLN